jgi:hypothetical protein
MRRQGSAMSISTYDHFLKTASGIEALARARAEYELSERAMRFAFGVCDKHGWGLTGPYSPDAGYSRRVFDNSGQGRGERFAGKFVGWEAVTELGPDGSISQLEEPDLDDLIDTLLQTWQRLTENPPKPTKPASEVYPAWQLAHEALRSAGEACSVPSSRVAEIIRFIPPQPGLTLAVARKKSRKLATLLRKDETLREVFENAEWLEEMAQGKKVEVPEPVSAGAVEARERMRAELAKSRDARRKQRARDEGRVKPRPRKPARTPADWIRATEQSLATRRAKLATQRARLKALETGQAKDGSWVARYGEIGALPWDIRRTEIGIERAEKALQTYTKRLATVPPR